ncbi:type IX secretion/gliding motility protein PorT/SprT [Mucilaginibacter polytrichastri]|uniref:Outer membrane protein beta-barrel domain-containing protein n=1 Tax=Mucilaginibacter polytrichastri TaxID=1302689 RepID=A0A1Q5ZU09_9SPHI|nr:porin family protein [Mucilaginibacter polytrichastri]OKS85247.1 hypothetical protein RG47T_0691 [Mucilaginibacter polytrichastri]SFS42063.1 probable protein-translocating porin PorT [Mucilaginibacter polytrichastri]
MTRAGKLILFLLFFCTCKSWAQYTIVPSWGGGADQQDLSFGFTFQYINSDFKIVKQADWQTVVDRADVTTTYKGRRASISSNSLPGFGIGFVTRYSFNEHLEIRTTPELVFADKQILYTYLDATLGNDSKQIQTTSVDVPLLLKLKSDRIGDMRVYLIGGLKTSFAINKKPNNVEANLEDKAITLKRNYNAWEAGVGFDIYFEYFKLSPELKVSNSFNNMLASDKANPFTSPLSKLFLHTISFSLYFE